MVKAEIAPDESQPIKSVANKVLRYAPLVSLPVSTDLEGHRSGPGEDEANLEHIYQFSNRQRVEE